VGSRRAALLIVCLLLGGVVGFVGVAVSGSPWWYLAIPGAVAAGWLAVANPENCIARTGQGPGGSHGAS